MNKSEGEKVKEESFHKERAGRDFTYFLKARPVGKELWSLLSQV